MGLRGKERMTRLAGQTLFVSLRSGLLLSPHINHSIPVSIFIKIDLTSSICLQDM